MNERRELTAQAGHYLGLREADCGCCYVVDAVALRQLLHALNEARGLRKRWDNAAEKIRVKFEYSAFLGASERARLRGKHEGLRLTASELSSVLCGEGVGDILREERA